MKLSMQYNMAKDGKPYTAVHLEDIAKHDNLEEAAELLREGVEALEAAFEQGDEDAPRARFIIER